MPPRTKVYSLDSRISAHDSLIESFEKLKADYPNSRYYAETLDRLKQDRAELVALIGIKK